MHNALALSQPDKSHLINLNLGYTYKRFSTLYAKHRKAHIDNGLLFYLKEGFNNSIDYNIECVKHFLLSAQSEEPLDPNTVSNLVQAYNSCLKSCEIGTTVPDYIRNYERKVSGLRTSIFDFYNQLTALKI